MIVFPGVPMFAGFTEPSEKRVASDDAITEARLGHRAGSGGTGTEPGTISPQRPPFSALCRLQVDHCADLKRVSHCIVEELRDGSRAPLWPVWLLQRSSAKYTLRKSKIQRLYH